MSDRRQRVFLTGGSSFIGRNILEQMSDEYQFIAPTHSELDLLESEKVYQFLKENPVDLVIHAANLGGNRKQKDLPSVVETNLRMFFSLVRCSEFFRHMYNLGSGAEYDKRYPILKVKESEFGRRVPGDAYGFYKYVCAKYANESAFLTHLRLFAVFGKYEDWQTRFISSAIIKVLSDSPIVIHQDVVFDYLYVDDFIHILRHFFMVDYKSRSVNIGRGVGFRLSDLASIIIRVIGKNVPVIIESPGVGNEYTCDTELMHLQCPGLKFKSIEHSISELAEYYSHNMPKEI